MRLCSWASPKASISILCAAWEGGGMDVRGVRKERGEEERERKAWREGGKEGRTGGREGRVGM